MQSPLQLLSSVVNILIAINIVMFIGTSGNQSGLNDLLALHFSQNENYHVWQYVTHMFMHGSLPHLLFNMFALWMFGTQLEKVLGKSRFILFYFACGIGAALIYNAVNQFQFNEVYDILVNAGISTAEISSMIAQQVYPPKILSADQASTMLNIYHAPMVGASGAIYGVLVAYALTFPNAKLMLIFIPYPIAAKYFVPVLIAIDLFSGVTGFSLFGGGVAHFAHVGGAIIGFILMLVWRNIIKRSQSYTGF
ncbi:rhomboid family intramembrane serine protease [Cocleimonas sp. KMM 6892]|uniref:rhomboid family intramembrane serine protease n=1 Tax=unclassified Cocleimonas TaxID=2639732 RepID=UPI002DBC6096|nr:MULTISPECIES: rhomboid family intramembrane serine protease [unclassified Cocleimonas]MEB8434495.1 rhomboid family intramembrane serine protease [Cocleimonas sp. KMM 6892]MEC4717388.1 rhomboid family intramembrane serine protease [Cocleimonas sp. KMM 6895]MEC4746818.1 rhomboid family intramembrane serine protease [Cocleimonas sp. KMM 6896]